MYDIEQIKNTIICGDALEELKKFPDNSIDTIITDPPYGIGFMGKDWDNFKPDFINEKMRKDSNRPPTRIARTQRSNAAGTYDLSVKGKMGFQNWMTEIAKELLRVTKPGGTMLIFGGTRTFHRLACAIEDAGWIIKDCIMWIYGSGFPKAEDLSLAFDKRECRKQLTEKLGRKPTKEEFKKEWKGFRKIIGEKKHAQKGVAIAEERGAIGGGSFGEERIEKVGEPKTPEAKLWNGWKSHGLKPAYEPILVAMKPNEGSYAENALKHGVAGLNIDKSRIPIQKGDEPHGGYGYGDEVIGFGPFDNKGGVKWKISPDADKGRFPANIILDEEAAKMLDEQAGKTGGGHWAKTKITGYGKFGGGKSEYFGVGEKDGFGGASRFFYVAKASREERNRGCENLPEKEWGKDSLTAGIDRRNTSNVNPTKLTKYKPKNNHPTVKPLKLMEYLCILTKTPTGGIILDPFVGSGTTCMAAKLTKRNWIGIEKEKEYCEIAEARIKAQPEPLF